MIQQLGHLEAGPGGAEGVAHQVADPRGGGGGGAGDDLIDGGVTDMLFDAYYRSTAASVTAGVASADVQFVVAVN